MNKPSKCKNCQWYGKPYWSITNPCDNCPMENVETFTHWVDPTIEELEKEIERLNNIINEVANDILKELNENKHLSYGVALNIRQKLLNYQELKEGK